jgi:hypothetical protein
MRLDSHWGPFRLIIIYYYYYSHTDRQTDVEVYVVEEITPENLEGGGGSTDKQEA